MLPGPNRQEDDAKFGDFLKRADGGPSRAGRVSKTFPEVPIVFRVSSGNPESRLSIPLGVGISRVGWESGMLHSCSVSQNRKILLHRQRNSPCSSNPEFESRADSQQQDSFPVA